MRDLIEAKNTLQFLKEHGLTAKKRFGQNFLIDRRVMERILDGAEISKEDTVVEIGPGIGTLTQGLCERAGHVISVEIDKDMIPLLSENLKDFDNYEIINDDVLKVDLKAITGGKRVKVAANLPYYITTPILMELFESGLAMDSVTVMVQKEVAERMQAAPGGKDYGALTLAVSYYAKAQIIANVPSNCFTPRPNVDSAVICLKCYDEKPVKPADEKKMFAIIKASFAQRRKTLVNSLKNDPSLGVSREMAETALNKMGLNIDIRGERLSLEQFAELSDILFS